MPFLLKQEDVVTDRLLRPVSDPLTLTSIRRGFEAEVFMGWMPFLSPNQQGTGFIQHLCGRELHGDGDDGITVVIPR